MKKKNARLVQCFSLLLCMLIFLMGCNMAEIISFSKEELSHGLIRIEFVYRENWEIHPKPLIIAELTDEEKEDLVVKLSEIDYNVEYGRPKLSVGYGFRLVYKTTEVSFFKDVIGCGLHGRSYDLYQCEELVQLLDYYAEKYTVDISLSNL